MSALPPGTILQLMYLKERLGRVPPGTFVEIGPGSGEITALLLGLGWKGYSFDLEDTTVKLLQQRFSEEISRGDYQAINGNFLDRDLLPSGTSINLVISCMVIEHLESDDEAMFMKRSEECLAEGGMMIGIVPASPDHWGIEDDIAGHCRRYTRESLAGLASKTGWTFQHIASLTYPLSNMLLPVSNYLVNRSEKSKLQLSNLERTKQSGHRDVKYKTNFPSLFELLLNEVTMYPVYLIQKAFLNTSRALVLYFEARPDGGEH